MIKRSIKQVGLSSAALAVGLIMASATARAQALVTLSSDEPPEPVSGVVELTVDPVAIGPEPLRWELLPPAHEIERGNAAVVYGQAALSNVGLQDLWEEHAKQIGDLSDLSMDELAVLVSAGGIENAHDIERRVWVTNQGMALVRRAARMKYADWNLQFENDPIGVMLSHLSQLRQYARLLQHTSRWALVEGDFEAAHDDLQTLLAMTQHLSGRQAVTLIESLVGVAIAGLGQEVLVEWTTRPNAPNLYWAVTDLNYPVVDLRAGLRGERSFIFWMFPELADPEPQLTDAQWIAAIDRFFTQSSYPWFSVAYKAPNTQVRLTRAWLVTMAYPHAKWWLQEKRGWTADQAAAISPLDAVARAFRGEFVETRDVLMIAMTLPPAEALPWIERAEDGFPDLVQGPGGLGQSFAGIMLPAITAANRTLLTSMQRFAQLRTLEALRHHAAVNEGAPPAALGDIDLPIPTNPWTGEPFPYRVEDGVAVLGHGVPEKYADERRHKTYHITFRTPAVSAEMIRE